VVTTNTTPMNNVIFLIKNINNRVAQNKTVINLALNMLIPNSLKKGNKNKEKKAVVSTKS
jgi:hypothetical protein